MTITMTITLTIIVSTGGRTGLDGWQGMIGIMISGVNHSLAVALFNGKGVGRLG